MATRAEACVCRTWEQVIDGRPAGAPLGTYTGIDPAGEPPYGVFGGTFRPFTDHELGERYPDPREYVDRVTRAADRLLAEGYIVEADRDAYVRAAAGIRLGRQRLFTPTQQIQRTGVHHAHQSMRRSRHSGDGRAVGGVQRANR
jgi:hypothetical protein